ncbi:LAMI_0F08966g1_1 [Lachancea mirantina]|uniref:Altered inheritance of mitochondria protein 24, mitochondrial n=1 Tax=Lachancea mirantina TaxID=1230905 RepID=A0A1G4K0R8_9SACH|nr:LAMI_0F08966g1_1 [Lachancea mirantina]
MVRVLTMRRSISLMRPNPGTIVPAAVIKARSGSQSHLQVTDTEPLFAKTDNLLSTRCRILGQPPTLASVSVPASVPFYVRRGCLVSISDAPDVILSHTWAGPVTKFLRYGSLRPALYHEIVAPEQFNALVAPNVGAAWLGASVAAWLGVSATPFRTLCLLDLDGTSDWCVFGRDAVIAYERNTSLEVRDRPLFSLSGVGGKHTALPAKHQIIQGRGNILLSGAGSVYTITLDTAEDDTILRSEHLLGISGTSRAEIASAITTDFSCIEAGTSRQTAVSTEVENESEFDLKQFVSMTKNGIVATWNYAKRVYSNYINGTTKFLRIKGPRTILVQSSYNAFLPATPMSRPRIEGTTIPPHESTPKAGPDTYLNYVTVSRDGSVEFKSTPNFQRVVHEIEERGRNK